MRSALAITVLAIVSVCFVHPLPAQFLADQSGSRSWLGVVLRDIDVERSRAIKLGEPRGAEVVGVQDNSPAEQAGIKVGDVLLSYNSEPIVGAQQLGRLVSETPPGRKVKMEIWRDGKTSNIFVTTGAPNNMAPFNMPQANFARFDELMPPTSIPTPYFCWINKQLGVESEALNSQDSGDAQFAEFFGVMHGVLVRAVAKNSPAAKAGIRAGDVLTQIGGHPLSDPKDITYCLRQEQHGTKPLPIEITRDHKSMTVKVNLTPEP